MSTDPIRDQVDGLLEQAVPHPGTEGWERPIPIEEAPLPEFPVDALGSDADRFARELARALQVPSAMPAMLMLAAAATAVSKKREVLLRRGWTQPLNLYVFVAMSPGERKTSVMRAVTTPITRWEGRRKLELTQSRKEGVLQLELAEGRLREAKQRYARAKSESARKEAGREATEVQREIDALNVPVYPRLRADDVTPEKLGQIMGGNGGRIAILATEGGIVDILAGRYEKSGKPNLDLFLKGWDGLEQWSRDRVSSDSVSIERPLLTFGLAVQPDVIRSMAGHRALKDRGLIGRMLFAIPRSLIGHRDVDPDPADAAVLEWWDSRLTALLDLPDERDELGETATRPIEFGAEAQRRLVDFQREIEVLLGEDDVLGEMGDWGGKLVGHVGRIAGLLHLIDGRGDEAVEAAVVDRAIKIGRFLIPHAQAAYALLDADPDADGAKRLLRWIRRHTLKDFTARDGLDAMARHRRRMETVHRALAVLLEHGYIREVEGRPAAATGRKPSPAYGVNPYVHASTVTAEPPERGSQWRSGGSADASRESGAGAGSSGGDAEVSK